jgi:hypothetical protein
MLQGTHQGRHYVSGLDYTPLLTIRNPPRYTASDDIGIPYGHYQTDRTQVGNIAPFSCVCYVSGEELTHHVANQGLYTWSERRFYFI